MNDIDESEVDRVMVDIETLGIGPGAAIVSIGAVRFGPDGITDTFEMSIDLVSCERAGLTIDASTVQWWMKQDDAAREQLAGGTRLDLVLRQFSEWYDDADEIWANSPAFDCAMLKAAYEAEGLNEPWYFYEERDVRTVKNLPVAADFEFQGVEHDALDDAVHQAEVVAQTLQFMQTHEHELVTDGGRDTAEADDDQFSVERYSGMEYICESCGLERTFDGVAVKTRSPFGRDDTECAIHMMHLQNREAYWNGEVEPTEVVHFA